MQNYAVPLPLNSFPELHIRGTPAPEEVKNFAGIQYSAYAKMLMRLWLL